MPSGVLPNTLAKVLRGLGLEKTFLKYLMLSTPSSLPGQTGAVSDPKGFRIKSFDYTQNFFNEAQEKKSLAYYDHIYEQIHNESTERKVWLMSDILSSWITKFKTTEGGSETGTDGFGDSSAFNNHFIGKPDGGIYLTSHPSDFDAATIDFHNESEAAITDYGDQYVEDALVSLINFIHDKCQEKCQLYEQKVKYPQKDMSEVVAYRIEKIKVSLATTDATIIATPVYETVQNMWFLATDFEVFDYLDTQVKYGPPVGDDNKFVSYIYRIHSYDFVYATKYSYNLTIPGASDQTNNQIFDLLKSYRTNEIGDMVTDGTVGYYVPNYTDEMHVFGDGPGSEGLGEGFDLFPSADLGDFSKKLTVIRPDGSDRQPFSMNQLIDIAKEYIKQENDDLVPSSLFARFFAEFDVISEPNPMIVEQIIYQTDPIIVTSKPPIPPMIEILPYQGISDKIMIKLAASNGFFKDIPVAITHDDHDRVIKTYISQGMTLERAAEESSYFATNGHFRTMMEFQYDDFESKFEFFELNGFDYSKTLLKPSDFQSGVFYGSESNTFFFEKTIALNTKYYFMARTVDRHGQKSNPTAIYEFEMIRDGIQGPLIPVFKKYDPPAEKPLDDKKVKKYLAVKPSESMMKKLQDTILTSAGALAPDAFGKINDQDDTFINKRFKMRLTSKTTGRKIDLNVRFNLADKGFVFDPVSLNELLGETLTAGGSDPEEEEI